jgi:hypothetical protein
MARYQVLYWRHIPLGVKAIDVNGVVRENLPPPFHDIFQATTSRSSQTVAGVYTTSGFRWGKEHDREGTAAEVVKAVIKEIVASWDEAEALARFEAQRREGLIPFLNIEKL